jgi:integrase
LIDKPIEIPRPKRTATLTKRSLSIEEISRLLEACHAIEWERRRISLPASQLWRSLILFAYNSGLTIKVLLKLDWQWLITQEDHSWFIVPAQITGKSALKCFVSPAALAAIERLRDSETKLVFPFPYRYNHARAQFSELLKQAKVSLHGLNSNKFQALRLSCNEQLSLIDPYAAALQLGRPPRRIARSEMLNHATSARILAEAHKKLPQPSD